MATNGSALEEQIAQWRTYLRRRKAFRESDAEELEGHLRDQIAALTEAGLAEDEAFLVAVKRLGQLDALSREFALEHSGRLWKQLVLAPGSGKTRVGTGRNELAAVLGFAAVAALAVKAPELFGYSLEDNQAQPFYARNISLFAFTPLLAYFVWKRSLDLARCLWLAAICAAVGVFANVYPFVSGGATEVLTVLHAPITLWLAVGIAHAGGRWRAMGSRMDFVRYSGELVIYYVLIALGGGVLMGSTLMMFAAIGLDVEDATQLWIMPCGAMGAVIIGSWLVEAKQSVIENMAPVLTRLFTPLFAASMLAYLGTMAWTGSGIDMEREVLIGFDLLLAVVLGLLLYSISARDPQAPPDAFDALQLLLVVSALAVDVVALAAIGGRIGEFGFSANKTAALGENLILLVNLGGSAWLYARFLLRRGSFAALERWQTAYLPVYSVWAGFVLVAFPPLFDYV